MTESRPDVRPTGTAAGALRSLVARAAGSAFVREVGETLATRLSLLAFGIVTSVIVARILGPEGRGLFAVAGSVGAIGVQFGSLGLHAANTFYAARDPGAVAALLGNSLAVSLVLGGGIALAAGAVFHLWPGLAPVHGAILALGLLTIPFGLGYLLLQNLLLGAGKVRAYNGVDLVNRVLQVALVGAIILLGLVTPVTVYAAIVLATAACLAFMLRRLAPLLPRFPLPSWRLFMSHIGFGLRVYLADLFAFLVLRINLLIVQYRLGAEQTGYYSVAAGLSDMALIYPVTVGTLLFPRLSAMREEGEQWRLARRMTGAVAWQMALVCAAAALLARFVVPFLYGREFLPAVPLVHLAMAAVFLLSVQGVQVKYLAARGYPAVITWIWLAVLLVNLPLAVLLVRRVGVEGAFLAAIASHALLLALVFFFAARHHRRACGEAPPP